MNKDWIYHSYKYLEMSVVRLWLETASLVCTTLNENDYNVNIYAREYSLK